MRARILTAAAAFVAAGMVPAGAADPQLVNLVMPNAVVVAGINVDTAKTSTFGQYVLSRVPGPELQQLTAATGFNPTQDVNEVLAASGGPQSKSGLVLARGTFNASQIEAAAAAKGGSTTESYNGVTILEDPKQTHGVAFLNNNTIAAAGDVASVKGAIDRQNSTTASLPAAVLAAIAQWSGTEDAWVITTVPPSSLHGGQSFDLGVSVAGTQQNALAGALVNIQSAAGGVKFGSANAEVTGQAVADNAQDATALVNAIQLLVSMGQLQSQNNPDLQALAQSVQATANGTAVNISCSVPEATLQAMMKPHANVRHHRPAVKQ